MNCLMSFAQRVTLILLAVCSAAPLFGQDFPALELVGTATIPGDAADLSGDSALLENGEPRNRLGGFSALDYSGTGNQFAALSDRGPDDGAVGYPCRVQTLEILIQPGKSESVTATVVRTTLFTDSRGRQLTGSSAAIEPIGSIAHRFDPEGFRFGPMGRMFVSDEYGPVLLQFAASGREIFRFTLPEHMQVRHPSPDRLMEVQVNDKGRASNRGMEGLAVSRDGKSLVGLMQSPLLQDAERTDDGLVSGRNCRLIQIDIENGRTQEFVYQLESVKNGNSEIVAYAPNQFLVLERDSLAGNKAAFRKLIHIDVTGATDVSDRDQLPSGDLPAEIVPAAKKIFLDLLDPQWGLAGESMPEKLEGLTFGPQLPDGRSTLLVGSDNDFESRDPSVIWVFALRR